MHWSQIREKLPDLQQSFQENEFLTLQLFFEPIRKSFEQ